MVSHHASISQSLEGFPPSSPQVWGPGSALSSPNVIWWEDLDFLEDDCSLSWHPSSHSDLAGRGSVDCPPGRIVPVNTDRTWLTLMLALSQQSSCYIKPLVLFLALRSFQAIGKTSLPSCYTFLTFYYHFHYREQPAIKTRAQWRKLYKYCIGFSWMQPLTPNLYILR